MYKLIHRNIDFIVVAKAAGVSFHRQDEACGLVAKIKTDLGLPEIYPVHRLDKITSGLLIFALNKVIAAEIAAKFADHAIEKYYLAIAGKKPKKKQGLILGDMEKSRRGCWKLMGRKSNPAVTQFFSKSMAPGLRLFILKPRTGRTHQLRVAMKSIAAPVLGDTRYGQGDPEIDRAYLHCYALRFSLHDVSYSFTSRPETGRFFCSADFLAAWKDYECPWQLSWPQLNKR